MFEFILWLGVYLAGAVVSAYFFGRVLKLTLGVAVFEALIWPVSVPILIVMLPVLIVIWAAGGGD